jgi:nucleoside-diphosphate-sugar epimerase
MANILVTGGTGFIGSALVKRLAVNPNNHIYVTDNFSRGKNHQASTNITTFEIDIRDKEKMFRYLFDKRIDTIFHLAFVNGTENFYNHPDEVLDVAVKGMQTILDFARRCKTKDLILVSSSEIYQESEIIPTLETQSASVPDVFNPRYSYGGGKLINELMAIHQGSKYFDRVVIVRPHNVYGPAMGNEHVIPQLINKVKEGFYDSIHGNVHITMQGDGTQTRSFIYIDDFIDGMMVLYYRGEHLEAYNLGIQEERKISSVLTEIAEHLGRGIHARKTELPKGGVTRRCPDTFKIRQLGFEPKISFREGMKRTIDSYMGETK